jgi:hypothetical protein
MNKSKTDIDPRAIAADFFRKLGGMDGMVKWGKTHRSLAYQLIAKLLAQPLVQNSVTVNVRDDGEARAKLEQAFYSVIDARHKEHGAVFHDGERIIDHQPAQIEHQPATVEPRPATADPQPATVDAVPQPVAASREPAAVEVPAAVVPPLFTEPSTTARYLEWASTRRDTWRNYG